MQAALFRNGSLNSAAFSSQSEVLKNGRLRKQVPIQKAIFLVKFQCGNPSLAFYQLLYRVVGTTCFI